MQQQQFPQQQGFPQQQQGFPRQQGYPPQDAPGQGQPPGQTGQFPNQQPAIPAPWRNGAVPSWEEMTMGRNKLQLLNFIGTLVAWNVEVDNYDKDIMHLQFDNVQVIDSRSSLYRC